MNIKLLKYNTVKFIKVAQFPQTLSSGQVFSELLRLGRMICWFSVDTVFASLVFAASGFFLFTSCRPATI